jgi:hypothetical protein
MRLICGSTLKSTADFSFILCQLGTMTMSPRTRKFIGTLVLLAFLIIYVLLAMAVAIVMQVNQSNGAATLVFYILAGLLWVIPAGLIVQWMQTAPTLD